MRNASSASRCALVGKEVLGREPAGVLLDAGEHFVRDAAAAVEGGLERGEPGLGLVGRRAHVHEANLVTGTHEVAANRRGGGLQGPPQRAIDRARMAKILAHQPFDLLVRRRTGKPQTRRGPFLQLVAEHVVMPLGLEMKDGTHPQQKLFGIVQGTQTRAALPEKRGIGDLGNRLCSEQIAQTAGRLLDVRLELVERVVEARVPLDDERPERIERPPAHPRELGGPGELIEQRRIARDNPGVGQRQQEFGIVLGQARPFVDLAHVMADRQAQIPNRVEKAVQKPLVLGRDGTGKQHQQVDVGVEAQLAASVAAEGEDADRLRERSGLREQLLDDRIHAMGVLLERLTAAVAPFGRRRQLRASRVDARPAHAAWIGTGRDGGWLRLCHVRT